MSSDEYPESPIHPPPSATAPEFRLDSLDVRLEDEEPVKIIRRRPQIPYPLHTHSFAELVVITAGTGDHRVEDRLIPVAAGDVFVILGDRAHGYENLRDLHLTNLLFRPDLLRENVWDLSRLPGFHALFTLEPQWRGDGEDNGHLRLTTERLERVSAHIDRMEGELGRREEGYRFMAVNAFLRLVGDLSRWYSGAEHPGARRLSRIGAVLALLEHNLDRVVSLEEMLTLTGMSASTLNRAFRRAVDLPPVTYHLRLRIRKAADLLRSTDLSVGEVAGRTGFEDANYFTRQFRKIFYVNPSQYRRIAK